MPHRPLTAAGRERVVSALDAGSEIEAIRLYRMDTLSSLAEAKAGVDEIAATRATGPVADPSLDLAPLLFAGRRITAIKEYRLARRVDLRTAKDAVDKIEADLRRTDPGRFASPPATGGCGWLVVIVAAVAAGAAYAWHAYR